MESTQGGLPLSLLETGRLAASTLTNTGAAYPLPYDVIGDSVIERTAVLDETGHFIFVPHVDIRFFSSESQNLSADFTHEEIHGELLKALVVGGPTVYMDNADQPGGGDGSWDLFRPVSPLGEEHIINPGLFINPADGDISGGNLVLHVY